MSQPEPHPDQLIRVVDALMDDLARLSTSPETKPETFFPQLQDTVQTVLNPDCFVVIAAGPDKNPYLVSGQQDKSLAILSEWSAIIENSSFEAGEVFTAQNQAQQITAAPILIEGKPWGAVATQNEAGTQLQAANSILVAIGEVTAQFIATNLTANQSIQADWFKRFFQFSLSAHSSLETSEAASILANDARILFSGERAQLYDISGNRVQLRAVSSVAVFEKRTSLLKLAKQLALLTARERKPVLSTQQASYHTALKNACEDYATLSGMEFFACFPLRSPTQRGKREFSGVLIVEFTTQPSQLEFVNAANVVLPHAGLSLDNAKAHSGIPFRRTTSWLSKALRIQNLSKLAIGLIIFLVAIVVLFTFQTDFKIRISGELRPHIERVVFAPKDAFVDNVLVKHGQKVTAGQLLVELSSPELKQSLEEIISEITKLSDYRASKQILLNQAATGNTGDATLQTRLASEIADLEFQIQSLGEKRTFTEQQTAELRIHAPITGTIVTWDVQQALLRKPVRWGDPLLKIADESSQWELRLKAPENKVAYILQSDSTIEARQIEYFFKSSPNQKFETSVRQVANSTEEDHEVGPSVSITCDIDPEQVNKRHGAKVVGDVICGRRSIGYIWTYEFVDAIKRRFVW